MEECTEIKPTSIQSNIPTLLFLHIQTECAFLLTVFVSLSVRTVGNKYKTRFLSKEHEETPYGITFAILAPCIRFWFCSTSIISKNESLTCSLIFVEWSWQGLWNTL
jgi:hypothetical protein